MSGRHGLPLTARRRIVCAAVLLALPVAAPAALWAQERQQERDAMVDRQIAARGVSDDRVLRAMRTVPRHRFVPERLARSAYADNPLPIGEGQTISQTTSSR